jgi:hypothetical protein
VGRDAASIFIQLTGQVTRSASEGVRVAYPLAELNDLLAAIAAEEIADLPRPEIHDPYLENYVAAMVELAAHRNGVVPPTWTPEVPPLKDPVFGVPWLSMRAHLLLNSPIPFRRRNIFIDSSLGARV